MLDHVGLELLHLGEAAELAEGPDGFGGGASGVGMLPREGFFPAFEGFGVALRGLFVVAWPGGIDQAEVEIRVRKRLILLPDRCLRTSSSIASASAYIFR